MKSVKDGWQDTIKVAVTLMVASDEPLTENDKAQVVADCEYDFSFTERMNGNRVAIIDTEIVDILG